MPSRPTSLDRSLRLALPATSANLARRLTRLPWPSIFHLRLRAERAPDFFVTAEGRDAQICGRMENHLIVTTYCEVLESENRKIAPLRIHVENEIPIGRGCGSSAAARLAGIALAVHFGHLRWKDDRIVGEASMREHHPDKRICLLDGRAHRGPHGQSGAGAGGRGEAEREVAAVAGGSDAPLSTEQARRVLPFQYSRADAVTTFRIPCCCSRVYARPDRSGFPRRSKTVSISPIARRFVHCFRRSRN